MKSKNIVIKCPKCKHEYLPAEIFHPDALLGRPDEIVRTDEGKIDFFTGTTMNLKEEYECLNCETIFKVEAEIKFSTKYDKKLDFNEEHETIIYKNRITLEEPK